MKTFALLASGLVASAALAQVGSGGTATNGASSFTLSDYTGGATGFGPTCDFSVGGPGNPDHLYQAGWFYRSGGDSREFAFANATSSDWSTPNQGRLEYSTREFDAVMIYTVNGIGNGYGVLTQTLTVFNTTNHAINVNLFNYQDIDLAGTSSNDSAVLNSGNVIRVTDANTGWVANYEGTNAFAVGGFSSIRDILSNGSVDNLSNTGLPFGPGDFTGAFQWNFDLSTGGAATASATLTITNIPTPGALALGSVGGLVAIRRRRR
jgi:hypothetical protein